MHNSVIPLHTPVNKNTLRLCLKREEDRINFDSLNYSLRYINNLIYLSIYSLSTSHIGCELLATFLSVPLISRYFLRPLQKFVDHNRDGLLYIRHSAVLKRSLKLSFNAEAVRRWPINPVP